MSIVYDLKHILILLLALQISQCTNITKYDCVDAPHTTSIRTYNSIIEYQHNNMPYDPHQNYVEFNVTTIRQLRKNEFISYDSNYVRKLYLNNKRIETIDSGTFNELFCVKYLLLQDNLIETVKDGTFEGLYSVEELYLNGNNIKELSAGSFRQLQHLLKLDLSNNKISIISDHAFSHLRSLWELHLEHNYIQELRLGLFFFTPHLLKLYLGDNKLSFLEREYFELLKSLSVLDISNNGIKSLPPNLFIDLEKLTDLRINDNQLFELETNGLDGLERIHIENNAWQCNVLEEIVQKLLSKSIGITLNKVTYTKNVTVIDLGCYKGDTAYTAVALTTTGIPWLKLSTTTTSTTGKPTIILPEASKIDNHTINEHYITVKDKDTIISAIYNLKIVIILLIIVVIIFNLSNVLLKMNICDRYSRRNSNSNQFLFSGQSGSSLPLLTR